MQHDLAPFMLHAQRAKRQQQRSERRLRVAARSGIAAAAVAAAAGMWLHLPFLMLLAVPAMLPARKRHLASQRCGSPVSFEALSRLTVALLFGVLFFFCITAVAAVDASMVPLAMRYLVVLAVGSAAWSCMLSWAHAISRRYKPTLAASHRASVMCAATAATLWAVAPPLGSKPEAWPIAAALLAAVCCGAAADVALWDTGFMWRPAACYEAPYPVTMAAVGVDEPTDAWAVSINGSAPVAFAGLCTPDELLQRALDDVLYQGDDPTIVWRPGMGPAPREPLGFDGRQMLSCGRVTHPGEPNTLMREAPARR